MLLALVRFALRVFYRRIRYVGRERLSAAGPIIFVLNHPNALVDPLFIFDAVPRKVHFLAKAPLLSMPVLGRLIKSVGALPVYRAMDGADTARNQETFRQCHRVLASGGSIAIFPEGTTHSDTTLRPIKTGAARIALGAEAMASFGLGVEIVPVGLQYESKQTFRSDVTVWLGPPHRVADLRDLYGSDPTEAVKEETRRLAVALFDVTLNVDRQETLDLIDEATAIFSMDASATPASEDEAAAMRKQFSEGYALLSTRVPQRLARLRRTLSKHLGVVRRLGITTADVQSAKRVSFATLAKRSLAGVAAVLIAAPGVVLNWVPYRLVHLIATRATREMEVTATVKLLAALVLYPVWWIATATALGRAIDWRLGALVGVLHPLLAYLAMRGLERLEEVRRRFRAFTLARNPRRLERLRRHQAAIRQELQALAGIYLRLVEGGEPGLSL